MMKITWKKSLAILLLLAMSAFALIGCQPTPPEAGDGGSNGGDVSGDPNRDGAPAVKDFGGYEFVIKNDAWGDYEVCAPKELNGQGINDAVYNRNKKVESLYNITIKETGEADMSQDGAFTFLSQQAQSGDQFADLYSFYARPMVANFATVGYFLNLTQVEGLDMDAPWWDQAFFDAMTIDNHVYTMTGNMQTNDEMHQSAYVVNYSLFQKNFTDEDLYNVVTNGDWTWEKFIGYFQGFGQDTGILTKVDAEDQIGYCYGADMAYAFSSVGIRTFTLENGEPVLNLTSDKAYGLVDYLSKLFTGNMDTAQFGGTITGNTLLDYNLKDSMFTNGKMLFTTYLFFDVLKLLDMTDEVWYLPCPKFNKEQEYMVPIQPYFDCLAISAYVMDPARTALIADALGYYSDGLQDEVVDVLLQERLTHEVKPRELLIMTLKAKVYDMDYIADILGFGKSIITMMDKKSFEAYTSSITSLSDKAVNAKGRGTLQLFIKKYTQH